MRRVRAFHRSEVLRQVLKEGPTARAQLAERLGLTGATITRIARELIDAGVLVETDAVTGLGGPGRPYVRLELSPSGIFVVGLRLEAYAQILAIATLNGDILAERKFRVSSFRKPAQVLDRVAREFGELIARSNVKEQQVLGLGVAAAGIIDPANGIMLDSSPLGWRNVDIVKALTERLRVPVAVENILNATNFAETEFGKCRGMKNVVLIRTSLGMGASTIAASRLIRGATFGSGQIAHLRINGDRQCRCGNVGCLETVASGRAIISDITRAPYASLGSDKLEENADALTEIIERASAGEEPAVAAISRAGYHLGVALATVRAFLDPEAFVFSGPVGSVPAYVEGARKGMTDFGLQLGRELPQIFVSSMEGQGAAVRLALSEFLLSGNFEITRFETAAA